MKKRLLFDKKFRLIYKKNEFKLFLLKYLNTNSDTLINWKNKSFKIWNRNSSLKSKVGSRIRNFCIISGRGRGLSKNYFSLSRNSFKHLSNLGLLPGIYKK